MKRLMIGFALLGVLTGTADAACSQSMLTGTWKLYLTLTGDFARCAISIGPSGFMHNSSCIFFNSIGGPHPATGQIKINVGPTCEITADIKSAGRSYPVTGSIAKGGDTVAGVGASVSFTMVKS